MQTIVEVGGLSLNRLTKTVCAEGKEVSLSGTEYKVLELLMTHEDIMVVFGMFWYRLYDDPRDPFTNIVNVAVHSLRGKLCFPALALRIESVRGQGYKLVSSKTEAFANVA